MGRGGLCVGLWVNVGRCWGRLLEVGVRSNVIWCGFLVVVWGCGVGGVLRWGVWVVGSKGFLGGLGVVGWEEGGGVVGEEEELGGRVMGDGWE